MVRSLVGALLAVGDGRRPVDWPASLLAAASARTTSTVAPAHGLTLVEVRYPVRRGPGSAHSADPGPPHLSDFHPRKRGCQDRLAARTGVKAASQPAANCAINAATSPGDSNCG